MAKIFLKKKHRTILCQKMRTILSSVIKAHITKQTDLDTMPMIHPRELICNKDNATED